jgi:hypothetical protein
MTTAAALASRLRSMPPEDLVALVVRRRLPSGAFSASGPTSVADHFDLAELLRSPESIDRALERLPAASLNALSAADPDPAALAPAIALALADASGIDDAVRARLADRTDLLPRSGGSADARPAAPVPEAADVTHATERAFAALTALAELLRATDGGSVHELAKGGFGAPLLRQLADVSGTTPDAVAVLLDLARACGLLDADDTVWALAEAGRDWLVTTWADRWVTLVDRWWASLDEAVADTLRAAGTDWRDTLSVGTTLYPAGGAWLSGDLDRAVRAATTTGLLADGVLTPAAVVLVRAADRPTDRALADAAQDMATTTLPRTVPQVYLQHDLTVIAPGPLEPADDDLLRRIATIEAPGLASRYRIDDDSVRRALRSGLDHDAVLAALERLSATGVPQPVRYLVDQVAARDGSIVVDHDGRGLGTVLRGTPEQLDLVGVDAELRHLGWHRADVTTLTTRAPIALVAAALAEERYPAVLAPGVRLPDASQPPVRRRAAESDPTAQARALVERLSANVASDGREPEQEWIGRQIDLAVRERAPIQITVRMPDGEERPFTIVPTAVASGRVRGRDVRADVERTLPLSLVVRVDDASA